MKNIVFVCQSTNYLLVDILNEFSSNYDKIYLLSGKIDILERNLNNKIKIIKIKSYNRKTYLKRIFTWVYATLQIFFLLLFKFRKYEIVYITNPPTSYLCSYFLNNPFSIIVYDIYPDALNNIGINNKNLIFKIWFRLNIIIFKKATKIFTLSKGMSEKLTQYTDFQKIILINNWSGFENISPIIRTQNKFLIENILDDKFVVLYSGNMGVTHSLETLIKVALKLVNYKDIVFVFIGDGKKKKILLELASSNSLKNCLFFPWQKSKELSISLAAANLGVVSLNNDSGDISVPSKTYNLLSAGVPLLCIAPYNSELNLLVKKYKNGLCFEQEEIDLIAEYILNLKNSRELQNEYSINSIQASNDFHYTNSKKYLEAFQ